MEKKHIQNITENDDSVTITFGKSDGDNKEGDRQVSDSKPSMVSAKSEEQKDNKMIMQFFLPKGYTLENAPTPNDPNIIITSIKEGYYAVIQYSGRHTDKRFMKHKKILHQALVEDGIALNEIPIKASYNSPYTLPIFRRNETMFNIDWKE